MADQSDRHPHQFRFLHRLRVRWVEVDGQGVVFNGHYLTYLDTAMSDYWRAAALPYPEGFKHLNGDVFVRRNTLEYHAPARLEDWLDIGIRCARVGSSSLTMVWAMWTQGRLLVSGETVYVFTSLETGRPMPVPETMRAQLAALSDGGPTVELVCGGWAELADAARAVRTAVFIQEQSIPEAEEWDDDDHTAVHAVVRNQAGLPLATGRLIMDKLDTACAKIGRMAVLRSARGCGLGSQVLSALIEQAAQRGIRHLALNAQLGAAHFYALSGWQAEGEVFDEVGIPHQRMVKAL